MSVCSFMMKSKNGATFAHVRDHVAKKYVPIEAKGAKDDIFHPIY